MQNGRARFHRGDTLFVIVCLILSALSIGIVVRYFHAAFPEAAIDLKYDRRTSEPIAERVLDRLRLPHGGMKHAVTFESDGLARIYLERTLGLERANVVTRDEVKAWYWRHRWFKPMQEEEYGADIAPTGELVAFARKLPEAMALPATDPSSARRIAEQFVIDAGVNLAGLTLVSESERQLPKRLQRSFTWESKTIRPGGAPYRYFVAIDGNAVTSFSRRLKVPEEWTRSYQELRSKNNAAGNVDTIFLIVTVVGLVATFVVRLRRGDMRLRFLLTIGIVSVVLVWGVSLNSWPATLASYNTTTSYPAFVAQFILGSLLQSLGTAMFLVVVCGAGEVLYRERLPQHLAIPKLWNRGALSSRRVFRALVLGYTLVAAFIAYQVVFYIVAGKFGAWAPADVPYDDMLNTALPWAAVLFAGFFPAFSEEFMSRAFSIPFFQRFVHSRFAAYVIAGFIWGFGHATYPNQPFYIRGLEVGLAGVILGFLMDRFGLLALLVWHYTIDAVYTALLLMQSGNTYYVVSGSFAAFVFAVPLILSVALLVRNRGFVDDEELTNATLSVSSPVVEEKRLPQRAELPPPLPWRRWRVITAVIATLIAVGLMLAGIPSLDDVPDYRTTRTQAKNIASTRLRQLRQPQPQRVIADPVTGFRAWNRESTHEEGGAPAGFDGVAAEYLLRSGVPMTALSSLMKRDIPTATWVVRFFTPMKKREYFVEVDPRNGRVIGYHKYEDERSPGAKLEQAAALAVANASFVQYGMNREQFGVQEALSFPQPDRRDWLFHYQQATPIASGAYRRVTVRVMGNEVTQFTTTIKVPDAAYREANEDTLLSTAMSLLKIIAMLGALALVVAGFVIGTRKAGIAWKRAAAYAAAFSIVPIGSLVLRHESRLFGYGTSVAWETFRLNMITDTVRSIGMQAGVLFLAFAGILAIHPHIEAVLRKPGRRRFGRDALIRVAGAVSLFAIIRLLQQLAAIRWPEASSVESVDAAGIVENALPSLLTIGEALFAAIVACGLVALYAAAVMPMRRVARWLPAALTIFIVFAFALEPSAAPRQMLLMLIRAAGMAAVVWIAARYLLGRNLLAWPVAIFLAVCFDRAASMLQHHRADLAVHGTIVAVVALTVIMLLASGREPAPAAAGSAPALNRPDEDA